MVETIYERQEGLLAVLSAEELQWFAERGCKSTQQGWSALPCCDLDRHRHRLRSLTGFSSPLCNF